MYGYLLAVYAFLCLSGSCLFFSVCERKKWAGVPLDVFVGVRLDDMVRVGIVFGPLGGKGWEGFEILMRHRFLPLSPVLLSIVRPWHFLIYVCSQWVLKILFLGWIHEQQETVQSPGWDKYGNNKACVYFQERWMPYMVSGFVVI